MLEASTNEVCGLVVVILLHRFKTSRPYTPPTGVNDAPHHELIAWLEEVQRQRLPREHGHVVEKRRQTKLEFRLFRCCLPHPFLQLLGKARLDNFRDHHILWLIFRPAVGHGCMICWVREDKDEK